MSVYEETVRALSKHSPDDECLVFLDVSGNVAATAAGEVERALRGHCDEDHVERRAFDYVTEWPVSTFAPSLIRRAIRDLRREDLTPVERAVASETRAKIVIVVADTAEIPASLIRNKRVQIVKTRARGTVRESSIPTVSDEEFLALEEQSLGARFSELVGCCDDLAEAVGAPVLELVTLTESTALYAASDDTLVRASYQMGPESIEFSDVELVRREGPGSASASRGAISEAVDALLRGDRDAADTEIGVAVEGIVSRIVGNKVVRHRFDKKLSRAMKIARRKHRGAWKAATMGSAIRKRVKSLRKHLRSGLIAKLQTSCADAGLDADAGARLLEARGFDPSVDPPRFAYEITPPSGTDRQQLVALLESAGVETVPSAGAVIVPAHGGDDWIASELSGAGADGCTVKTVGALNEARYRLRHGKIVKKVRVDRRRSAIAKKAARQNKTAFLKALAKGRKKLKRLLGTEKFKKLREKVSKLNNNPRAVTAESAWAVKVGSKLERAVGFADRGDVARSASVIAEVADESPDLLMLTGDELQQFVGWCCENVSESPRVTESIARELRSRLKSSHPDVVVEAVTLAKERLDGDTEVSDDVETAFCEAMDLLFEAVDDDVACETEVYKCLSRRYGLILADVEGATADDGDAGEIVELLRSDKEDLDKAIESGAVLDAERLYEMVVTLRTFASDDPEKVEPSEFLPVRRSKTWVSTDEDDEGDEEDGDDEDEEDEEDDYEDEDDGLGPDEATRCRLRREAVGDADAARLASIEKKIESPGLFAAVKRGLDRVGDRAAYLESLDALPYIIGHDVAEATRKHSSATTQKRGPVNESVVGEKLRELLSAVKEKIEAAYGAGKSEAKNTFGWVEWIVKQKNFVRDSAAFLRELAGIDKVSIDDVKRVAQGMI